MGASAKQVLIYLFFSALVLMKGQPAAMQEFPEAARQQKDRSM
jgi:hypothetical protein